MDGMATVDDWYMQHCAADALHVWGLGDGLPAMGKRDVNFEKG